MTEPAMPEQKRREHAQSQRPPIHALTGLRFFASIYVVLFHAEAPWRETLPQLRPWRALLGHGYLAVSLFFVLSGYVLAYNYGGRAGHWSTYRFLLARLARLYPVYLVALLLQLPFWWPLARVPDALAVLLLVQAWVPLNSTLPAAWNFPAWTLSVEWAFYLLFPALLAWTERQARPRRWAVALCVLSLTIGGVQTSIGARPSWLNTHLPMPVLRLPEFVLGMLLTRCAPRGNTRRWTLPATLLALAVLLGFNLHRFAILVLPVFALLIAQLSYHAGALQRALASRAMILLGGASYAVYLLQVPVLHLLELGTHSPLGPGMVIAVYLPVLLASGLLTFLLVEQPARRAIRAWGRVGRQA